MNSDRTHRQLLGFILAGFVVLATIYSLVTPIFEASDELWHYPMVKYLADHRLRLPVQQAGLSDEQAPWRQEGGQPPLYYMLGAALTFWIDTDDMSIVRRINPHADIGTIVPDNNANMILHDTDREAFPWSRTVLAVHLVRFLSITLGLGTLYTTYRLARELIPQAPAIALGAAAFTAFNPMFLFISAVINNDNLAILLASVQLLIIVRILKRPDPPTRQTIIVLGLVAGAGMLAKFQLGFLLILVALALLIVSLRHRDWRPVVFGGAISGGLTILIAGWWYIRNYDLYGDFTGINVFLDIVGRRAPPADLSQLWTERETFMMSYWGLFGGINVPMSDTVYVVFNSLALIGVIGLTIMLLGKLLRVGWDRRTNPARPTPEPTLPTTGLLWARLTVAIWPVIVFLSLIIWTRQTPASQGRLMFSAIASLNIGFAAGLAAWSPTNSARRNTILGITSLLFAGIASVVPFTAIWPTYTLDREGTQTIGALQTGAFTTACFREPDSTSQDAICLAVNALEGTLNPGEYVTLSPIFTVKNEMTRNWSIFVHLIDEYGTIEAQRDIYPGGGLIATMSSEPGDTWYNPIAVKLPPGLYTPQTLGVYVGIYDFHTYDRMTAVSPHADGENRVRVGQLTLETPPGSVPNAVDANFANKLTLLGYEISDRALHPGDSTVITLYWEARRTGLPNYAISYQIIDPVSFTKAAQNDDFPSQLTESWEPGNLVIDTRSLTVDPAATPGRYRLMIRVYPYDESGAGAPLRIRANTGGQSEDFVWLSWITIEAVP